MSSRRLRRRLRQIDSFVDDSTSPRRRAYLLLVASVALGLIAGSLVLENIREGHLLGLEVEGEGLQASLAQLLGGWDVSAAWISEVADSGALESIPADFVKANEEDFPVFPGIAWVGVARMKGEEVEPIYTTRSGTTEQAAAILSQPEAQRAIQKVLATSKTTFSKVIDLPNSPCEGPMLVLFYHDGDSRGPTDFVYSPACLSAMFRRIASGQHFGIEVFIDGRSVYENGRISSRFTFPLAESRLEFEARGIGWLVELESLPFPFNWQLAFPFLLFLAISGIGGLVFAWTRVEERERLLAEAMLETYRLTQKKSHFLAETSRLLAWHTDKGTETILPQIASRAVPLLGDGCGICLQEGEDRIRVISAHVDPEVEASTRRLFDQPFTLPGFSLFLLRIAERKDKRIPEAELDALLEHAHPQEMSQAMRNALKHCVVVPMLARGKPIGAVVVRMTKGKRYGTRIIRLIHDLGSRIALALDNSRLLKDRQQAVSMRDEFLSIASHELLTPVTALQTNIQSLLRMHSMGKEVSQERLLRGLDVANRQVRRLGRLVHELLDVSRLEAGRFELDPQRFDLGELVEEIVARYEKEAERLGCLLTMDCPLGAIGEWDRHRIEQVVTNLLGNAIKYGRSRPIHVALEAGDEEVRVRFEDQGVGIPEGELERIFTRFERAVTDKGYGGLGLGLYISLQIVEAHGGRIQVESELGQGSVFTLVLPRERSGEAPPLEARVPLRASTR